MLQDPGPQPVSARPAQVPPPAPAPFPPAHLAGSPPPAHLWPPPGPRPPACARAPRTGTAPRHPAPGGEPAARPPVAAARTPAPSLRPRAPHRVKKPFKILDPKARRSLCCQGENLPTDQGAPATLPLGWFLFCNVSHCMYTGNFVENGSISR
ncbi:mulatexin-like [Canis lupus familiaris]|uniref:mulatexin-like n=1 Tax=Canis lupus familiaris TaxID=9615 RepID=UPI0018F48022|nr:mulatexin-like [Canis lupus familiaris]